MFIDSADFPVHTGGRHHLISVVMGRPTSVLNWVWVVLIIAIAIVATAGIIAYVATVCIKRGGSYDGGLSVSTNGWKVWEYKLKFKCTR